MHPDHMPRNEQRPDSDVSGLPTVHQIADRTAHKRRELEQPFEDAVARVTDVVGVGIRRQADAGQTRFTAKGEIVNAPGRPSVSAARVFARVAEALRERGFSARVGGGEFDFEVELIVSWSCDTPDYRMAGD